MHRRKLPIGIQTFAKIREDDFYYVDKTAFIRQLVDEGSQYFLSRPRRFGKSLLIDTLAELFAGNEPLFRGLAIHPHWDWTTPYPVIRISFGGGVVRDRVELDQRILDLLSRNQRALGLACRDNTDVVGCFAELLALAHAATGKRAVVLVDEYDKPILDNLSDAKTARELRDGLRDLYSVIKDNDALLKGLMGDPMQADRAVSRLYDVLVAGDFAALRAHLESLFASIPYPWHTGNPIARFEGYYASVFYSHLAALGLDLTPEETSSQGRIDLTLKFNDCIWLFEFKVVELVPDGRALQQIKDRGYADKYRALGQPIHQIGIEFSRERCALVGFEVETL
ncbi:MULTISPECIES: AAA family ATPase [unclassified Thiocapsa]|uniref:AAA family ATPase n=1 Tax=unclassified Thiocapsa TaxID=2641286 RepID=UPI0035AEFFDE